MRWLASTLALVGAGGYASGCVAEERYLVENEAVAMTEDVAPAFVNEDDEPIFIVDRRLEFPIRRPQADTLSSLTTAANGMMLPYPRLPWVKREDIELRLDYVIANLDDGDVNVGIQINGINEFHEYAPGPEDFNQWERRFALGPKERVTGTITELEMDEIAIDLATVVNGAPNSNQVVQFQSQSGRDPRVEAYVPSVVPALVGVRAGISSGEAANIVLEITVRGEDFGDRLPARGEARWELPEPMLFTPIAPEEDE